MGSIPGLGRSPGRGYGNPFQYSYLENPHRQRSLVGYSPWGHTESDTTEATKLSFSGNCVLIGAFKAGDSGRGRLELPTSWEEHLP